MILNGEGRPAPPSEISRRLRQVDPAFRLRYQIDWMGLSRWALVVDWPPDDPRRREIYTGVVDPEEACDLLTYLPFDCSIDEAYGLLVNTLMRRNRSGDALQGILDRVHAYNANPNQGVVEETLAEVMEVIEDTLGKEPIGKGPRSVGGIEKLPPKPKWTRKKK